MPHRIYTRTGDDGNTRLRSGSRVSKTSFRVAGYGALYEVNAHIGWVRSAMSQCPPPVGALEPEWKALTAGLAAIQHRLFLVGHDLSSPSAHPTTSRTHIQELEHLIDRLRDVSPPWRPFTVPEGSPAATACYVATTMCRRAEREVLRLHEIETVPDAVLAWINRLSDLLFVAARFINHCQGFTESFIGEPPSGF